MSVPRQVVQLCRAITSCALSNEVKFEMTLRYSSFISGHNPGPSRLFCECHLASDVSTNGPVARTTTTAAHEQVLRLFLMIDHGRGQQSLRAAIDHSKYGSISVVAKKMNSCESLNSQQHHFAKTTRLDNTYNPLGTTLHHHHQHPCSNSPLTSPPFSGSNTHCPPTIPSSTTLTISQPTTSHRGLGLNRDPHPT